MKLSIPEQNPAVTGLAPVTTNLALTADYISMKNVISATVILTFTNAAAFANVISLYQATAVAGTGKKALAKACPVFYNEDVAASDALTRGTSAVAYTLTADIKNKKVIFEVDAEKLDVANNFDCLTVGIDASSEATNFVNVEYILRKRYPAATVLTD